jgi:hypothetical protein
MLIEHHLGESGDYCDYKHGTKLEKGELLVLKHKARQLPCTQGEFCRAFDCTFGHHCKYGPTCRSADCWFKETHGMEFVSDTFPCSLFLRS